METDLIQVWAKDKEWLIRVKDKFRKRGLKDVVHNMIKLIKAQKSEEELKWKYQNYYNITKVRML